MSNPQPRVNLRQLRNQAKDLHHHSQSNLRSRHPGAHPAVPSAFRRRHAEAGRGGILPSGSAARHWPRKRPRQLAEAGTAVEDREARFLKDELRALENLHDPLAELLQARLRRAGQTDVEARVQFTDQVTWAEFHGSRPIGCWSYSYLSSRLQVPRFSICPDNSTADGSGLRRNTDGDSNRDATLRHSGRGSSQTLCRGALRRHRGSVGAGDVSGHA